MSYNGKTVLLTGGSRGIGRATALGFAKRGANVVFTFKQDSAAAEGVQRELHSLGVGAAAIQADAADEAANRTSCRACSYDVRIA